MAYLQATLHMISVVFLEHLCAQAVALQLQIFRPAAVLLQQVLITNWHIYKQPCI
jgi:hypothetical protein